MCNVIQCVLIDLCDLDRFVDLGLSGPRTPAGAEDSWPVSQSGREWPVSQSGREWPQDLSDSAQKWTGSRQERERPEGEARSLERECPEVE
jgi:hypothetical protein